MSVFTHTIVSYSRFVLKEMIHLESQIISSCIHPHVVPDLYDYTDNLRKINWDKCIFDAMEVTIVSVWLPTILGYQYIFILFAWTVPLRWHFYFLLYRSIRKSLLLHGKLKGVVHPKIKMCRKCTRWRKQYYGSRTFCWELKRILMIHFFITNRETGVVWILVDCCDVFISWNLILMAFVHWRGSIGEQVCNAKLL